MNNQLKRINWHLILLFILMGTLPSAFCKNTLIGETTDWENVGIDHSFSFLPKVNLRILTLHLLEAKTQLPISDAFIFIRNTSLSITSDISGVAHIDIANFPQGELVITHLNYATITIPLSTLNNLHLTLQLMPKTVLISQVEVKTKRAKSKKRKGWMEQFERAFFGEGRKQKGMELLNPEVLWFEERGDTLIAHAIDYLSIINKRLGYQLRFYLEAFQSRNIDQTTYAGTVFFEDQLAQKKQKKTIEKRRRKTFERSKKYFFKSLVNNDLDTLQFPFGEAILDDNLNLLHFAPWSVDSLPLTRGQGVDTLWVANFFAFSNRKIVANWGTSGLLNDYAIGFLHAQSGFILIDPTGEILNPKEIIEVGYWTTERLADLLPLDYQIVPREISVDQTSKMIIGLREQVRNMPQEKIYLHFNKPYYSLTESIFFKAYLVNAHMHTPQTLSKVVYVDLIDPEGQLAKSWTLHTDKVMDGDFRFNATFKPGVYQFRAYTNFMRNQSREYFFTKDISIFDYTLNTENGDTQVEIDSFQSNRQKQDIQLTFFPEGGDLINGLSANIAFKANDLSGTPKDVVGEIVDQTGQIITKIKTNHAGLGLFNLIPRSADQYRAIIQNGAKTFTFPLPKARPRGMVMRVNNRKTEKIFIDLKANPSTLLEEAYLVGHVRGQIFCFLEDLEAGVPIVFDKSTLPTGIVHFTLFDSQDQSIAERLIFNELGLNPALLEINQDPTGYTTREKITLALNDLSTTRDWETINLSLAVTDQSVVNYPAFGAVLPSYLLLESDLKRPIPNPEFYLREMDNTKRFWLDLWMMTHGWRRFNWQELQGEVSSSITFLPESGYGLKGFTTEKGNEEKRLPTQVMLTSLDKELIYETQLTDEEGNFHFRNLPYLDSISFIIQGRVQNRKNKLDQSTEKLTLEGDRMVDFHFETRAIDLSDFRKSDKLMVPKMESQDQTFLKKYLSYEKHSTTLDSIYNSIWQIDFDGEVVVRGKRKPPFKFGDTYDLNQMDWVEPNKAGTSLLSYLYTRFNFEVDFQNGKLYLVQNRTKIPLSIDINGMGADKTGSNPARFLSLRADLIDYIYFNRECACISIQTRSIPRSLQIKLESGILNYDHPGYARAREFYAPDYSSSLPIHQAPDLRTAIHWAPTITLTKGESQSLSFYAADTPTTYEVRVEGVTDTGIPIFKQLALKIKG